MDVKTFTLVNIYFGKSRKKKVKWAQVDLQWQHAPIAHCYRGKLSHWENVNSNILFKIVQEFNSYETEHLMQLW